MFNIRTMLLVTHAVFGIARQHDRLLSTCTKQMLPYLFPAVMGSEVLEYIKPLDNKVVIDMTFGTGGHAELILKNDPTVKVLALDRDPESYALAEKLAPKYPERLVPLQGKFSDLPKLIEPLGYTKGSVDAMLFDYGCSELQIRDAKRGFSYELDGALDMRMDREGSNSLRAHDVLHAANEIDLKNIFKLYGKIDTGKKIARQILYTRYTKAVVNSTTDLAVLLMGQCELSKQEVHSAFRSLRYFVNDELNEISHSMLLAEWYLKDGGKLVTISEDFIDDGIIKNHIVGKPSGNFVTPLPMGYTSFTGPSDSENIVKKSPWIKLNKHVIIPEGQKLMRKTRKLRAVCKDVSS